MCVSHRCPATPRHAAPHRGHVRAPQQVETVRAPGAPHTSRARRGRARRGEARLDGHVRHAITSPAAALLSAPQRARRTEGRPPAGQPCAHRQRCLRPRRRPPPPTLPTCQFVWMRLPIAAWMESGVVWSPSQPDGLVAARASKARRAEAQKVEHSISCVKHISTSPFCHQFPTASWGLSQKRFL